MEMSGLEDTPLQVTVEPVAFHADINPKSCAESLNLLGVPSCGPLLRIFIVEGV